ncbi:alpha/beta fold hydrolase, partial [Streptomyces tendae]
MDILLIGGLWLDGSAWDRVATELESLGHRPVALTLPGQGDGAVTATFAVDSRALASTNSSQSAPRPTVTSSV